MGTQIQVESKDREVYEDFEEILKCEGVEIIYLKADTDQNSSKPERGDDVAAGDKAESKPKLSQGPPPTLHYAIVPECKSPQRKRELHDSDNMHVYVAKTDHGNVAVGRALETTWPAFVEHHLSAHLKVDRKDFAAAVFFGKPTDTFTSKPFGDKSECLLQKRRGKAIQSVDSVVLDIDKSAVSVDSALGTLDNLNFNSAIYTSWSHDPDGQHKYRIVAPVSSSVPVRDLQALTWGFAVMLDFDPLKDIDACSWKAAQYYFLPSSASGKGECYSIVDGDTLDPVELVTKGRAAMAIKGQLAGETGKTAAEAGMNAKSADAAEALIYTAWDKMFPGRISKEVEAGRTVSLTGPCPLENLHTPPSADTDVKWYLPGVDEDHPEGGVSCVHTNHDGAGKLDGPRFRQELGISLSEWKAATRVEDVVTGEEILKKQMKSSLSDYVFVVNGGKVYCTKTGAFWLKEDFRTQVVHKPLKIARLANFTSLPEYLQSGIPDTYPEREHLITRVDNVMVCIGETGIWKPNRGLGGHKRTIFSKWQDPRDTMKSDPELVEKHILKWGTDCFQPEQFSYLLDTLAFILQNPGHPPQVVLTLEGPQALGKTALVKVLLEKTYFATSITTISRNDIFGKHATFNEFLTKTIVLMDDFAATDAEEAEIIRTARAGGTHVINNKYGLREDAPTSPLFISTRNPQEANPRYVMPGDRSDCQLDLNPPAGFFDMKEERGLEDANHWLSEYIKAYVESWKRDDVVLAFRHFLAERNISNFVPGRALVTEGSQEVQAAQVTPYAAAMENLFGHGRILSEVSFVTTHSIIEAIEVQLSRQYIDASDFDAPEELDRHQKRGVKRYMQENFGWQHVKTKDWKDQMKYKGQKVTVLVKPSAIKELCQEKVLYKSDKQGLHALLETPSFTRRYLVPDEEDAKEVLAAVAAKEAEED